MLLVDREIKELLRSNRISIITPRGIDFNPDEQISGASIDLRLNNQIRRYKSNINEISLENKESTEIIEIYEGNDIVIQPHEILLTTTVEIVVLPPNIAGFITGRSSIARLGLMVQVTQDLMQAGHSQVIPLQLVNITNKPIRIKPYIRICQIILLKSNSNAETPYSKKPGAKYSDELFKPVESRISQELGPEVKTEEPVVTPEQDKLQRAVAELTQNTSKSNQERDTQIKFDNIKNIVNIVIAGALGALMTNFSTNPFPSNLWIIAALLIILCIIILVNTNWRRL